MANRRHDVVAVSVGDPRERSLPDVGFILLQDAETGETMELATRHPTVRDMFRGRYEDRTRRLSEGLRSAGVDRLEVDTAEPYATALQQFFRMRRRRLR